MRKKYSLIFFLLVSAAHAQHKKLQFGNEVCGIRLSPSPGNLWQYQLLENGSTINVQPPAFEVDNSMLPGTVRSFTWHRGKTLRNGVSEYVAEGRLVADSGIKLTIMFRLSDKNPVVRFCYRLTTNGRHRFTKGNGTDNFRYFSVSFAQTRFAREIRLSDFNEKYHATTLSENDIDDRFYSNRQSVMGPLLLGGYRQHVFLLAYEHGSQSPDRFLEFRFARDKRVSLNAVKGNYLNQQIFDEDHPYQTLWFDIAASEGGEEQMAASYRNFVLKYITENAESRKPYIFYNTWGRQERAKWAGGNYLSTMNLKTTLQEIDVAHGMGIEVYVLDVGWFQKTGDWEVNTIFFPDSLKQVKALLNKYGMKLGLWFNPMLAAETSLMLSENRADVAVLNGKADEPFPIWETESSVRMSLVSPYWEKYADKLISLVKQLGVSYFKWDGINQYGVNGVGHFYGNIENTPKEREESYAFQLPIYMSRIIDKVCRVCPEAIFDFDITEEGRSVGLQFLSSGKYFIMNNGPYFHSFNLASDWKSPLANGNANVFVNPGPARGWFTRSVLGYDKWIPSVLFLTHYQADGPEESQIINLASLILGQNGIWGNLLTLSPEAIHLFSAVLEKYKQVRDDITESNPVITGEPGLSPEIHEKISSSSGRGAVVVFVNTPGKYRYITQHPVNIQNWHTNGAEVHRDDQGRAIIEMEFKKPGAEIILFGAR